MGMTVKHEGEKIPTKVWDKKSSQALGDEAVKELVTRAFGQGKGSDGRALSPYSPAYGVQRRKKGLSTKPNLTVTGRLKESIDVTKVAEDGFAIESDVPYAGAVDAQRPFFGLGDEDMKNLQPEIEQAVQEAMKRSQK